MVLGVRPVMAYRTREESEFIIRAVRIKWPCKRGPLLLWYAVRMVIHVSGQDWFRAKQFVDQELANASGQGFSVVRVSTLDESWQERAAACASAPSLFSEKYCVVLSLEAKKSRTKDGKDQDLSQDTVDGLKGLTQLFLDSEHILLVRNGGAKSAFPSRSKKIVTQDFQPLKGEELVVWAVSYGKEKGCALSKTVARTICDACSGDTALVASEVEKLALFGSVSAQELLSYSSMASYFDWMQGLLQGNWKARADILHMDEHEASQRLAGLLNAVRIALALRARQAEFMQSVNPYWARSLGQWTKDIETHTLEQWFVQLLRFDIMVRTFRMTEPEALERFAFSVMH